MPADLETLATRIQERDAQGKNLEWENLLDIFTARCGFAETESFIRWARARLNYSRRHSFCLLAASRLVHEVVAELTGDPTKSTHESLLVPLQRLGGAKLEIIAAVLTERDMPNLLRFLRKYDVTMLDRDDLRNAVAIWLQKERGPKPQHPLWSDSLPSAEQLLLGLDDPRVLAKLDPPAEYARAKAQWERVGSLMDRYDPETRNEMRQYFLDNAHGLEELFAGIPARTK